MLTKTPVSTFKRALNFTLKTAFLVEAAGFAVSFGVWYKLNTDRGEFFYFYQYIIAKTNTSCCSL